MNLEVSQASKSAIEAVERQGGSVVTAHYNRLGLRVLLKPWKFQEGLIPRRALPSKKLMPYYLDPKNRWSRVVESRGLVLPFPLCMYVCMSPQSQPLCLPPSMRVPSIHTLTLSKFDHILKQSLAIPSCSDLDNVFWFHFLFPLESSCVGDTWLSLKKERRGLLRVEWKELTWALTTRFTFLARE